MKKKLLIAIVICCLSGCASVHNDVLGTSQSQVQMRSYQARSFDTTDKHLVLRAVISTMQDLGFIINKADEQLGTISGDSFSNASRLTVSVRVINDKQIIVRVNAQAELKAIEDPVPYRNFFNSLGQSLFLEAHEIN